MDNKQPEVSKQIYEVGSAMPADTMCSSFSGVDAMVTENTGQDSVEHRKLSYLQGLSFEGKVRVTEDEGEIHYGDVRMTLVYVLTPGHIPPKCGSEFVLEAANEFGHRIHLRLGGFTNLKSGMGVSINDVATDISYDFTGGTAALQLGYKNDNEEGAAK